MSIVVQKFGGTSVATPEKIRRAAVRAISARRRGNSVVVVVSAMGHTTDHLVKLYQQISPDPPAREYDMLLSTGEQVSAALLAMAIREEGWEAISLTGGQAGVVTDDVFQKARIRRVRLHRLREELGKGRIVVVTGFQGVNSEGDITTIGRGGSDTSAVVLAAALKAKVCDIYTDVDGVYTTDPRLVRDARKLHEISYDEMLEMASVGAQVVHPRAVETAKNYGVVIHLRSSFNHESGTFVKEVNALEKRGLISGVAYDRNVVKIGLLKIPDRPGIAAKLFRELGRARINIDMIIQSVHEGALADIAYTTSRSDAKRALEVTQRVGKVLKGRGVVIDRSVAKVSLVGIGMVSEPGVAGKMFHVLAENNINIEMISTSEIRISCIIRSRDVKKAVRALHEKFNLGKRN